MDIHSLIETAICAKVIGLSANNVVGNYIKNSVFNCINFINSTIKGNTFTDESFVDLKFSDGDTNHIVKDNTIKQGIIQNVFLDNFYPLEGNSIINSSLSGFEGSLRNCELKNKSYIATGTGNSLSFSNCKFDNYQFQVIGLCPEYRIEDTEFKRALNGGNPYGFDAQNLSVATHLFKQNTCKTVIKNGYQADVIPIIFYYDETNTLVVANVTE